MICLFLWMLKMKILRIKNGEEIKIDVKARVLTNPFCSANCSLVLEDLGEENILYYDNMYIKVSSPLSREYIINSNWKRILVKIYIKLILNAIQ